MAEIDIRRLDFTLLSVLASLLRTRKATATAVELAMTQSTVSHALARLREVFDDALFVRRTHGLEPTSRALALQPQLAALFELARQVLADEGFDPAAARGVVRIAASDYHCALHAAPLVARVGALAPHLKLSFRPLVRRQAVEALLSGQIEVARGRFWDLPAAVQARSLFRETYSVVCSHDRDAATQMPFDLEAYVGARHVVVSLDGELNGVVDEALRPLGKTRNVVAAAPYFLSALAAAAEGDVIVTLPSRLANAYAPRFGLSVFPPPVELPSFDVSVVVAAARAKGDLVGWLFETVLPDVLKP